MLFFEVDKRKCRLSSNLQKWKYHFTRQVLVCRTMDNKGSQLYNLGATSGWHQCESELLSSEGCLLVT